MEPGDAVRRVVALLAVALVAVSLVTPGPAAAATVPSAPRSVGATTGVGQVTVTWRAPGTTGGRRIDRYRVVRWANGVSRKVVTVGATARRYRFTGLQAGKRYSFTVRAHNAVGWGTTSAVVRAVPKAPQPAGFGTLTGPLGAVAPQLDEPTPALLLGYTLDFGTDPYDDPVDRPRLTPGGQRIAETPSSGGSSLQSEIFAFEALARRDGATLLKTETEIVYDTEGKKTDLLVQVDGSKVGVSVVRAVGFPLDAPYPESQAAELIDRKLDDIVLSSQQVSDADAWVKQVLVVLAFSQDHADTVAAAYAGLDAATRSDTVVYVVVTDGSDLGVYTSGTG